ncbi:MFS transporter [Candidatus Parcubacteria bacterium]|jgi:MFS family permease|nr:MAG: MFS transporter [Candidatus Parcubacteria bacterium]
MKKYFGVPKNVFFLGVVSMLNDFSNEMIQTVMPIFLTATLGAPVFVVGIIEGFADALASVLKIVFGWVSDKWKIRKRIAVAGYIVSVSTRPFFTLASNFWHVFFLRSIDRIGKGMRDAPRDALISESTDSETLGRSFGFHRMMDTFGGMMGPLVVFLLLPIFFGSYELIFLVAFAIGALAVITFVFVEEHPRENEEKKSVVVPKMNLSFLKTNRRFSLFLFSLFIFGLGTLPVALLLLRAPSIGIDVKYVPIFYLIYHVAFLAAAFPLGKIADSFGKRRIITLGFVAALASYISLMVVQTFFGLVISFILFGIYSAATDGVERALAARLVDEHSLAMGQGMLNAAIGISALLAGGIGGLLWTYVGPEATFVYAASLSFVGSVLFVLLMHVSFKDTK